MVCMMTQTDFCQQAVAQTKPPNLTRLKLEGYGWQPLPKIQRGEWPGFAGRLVSVDHKGRVYVGFTVRDSTRLATRERPGLSFHIFRFTSEGKADLSLALPTKDYFTNALYLGPNDQVLARANDTLQLLTAVDPTGRPSWQTLASCLRDCQISQSPSHGTLIVTEVEGPSYNPQVQAHTLLDLASSPPRFVEDCQQSGGTITDKFNYGQTSDGAQYFAWRWPLCEPEHKVELPLDLAGGKLRPLNDGLLLVLGMGRRRGHDLVSPLRGIELVSPDGQVRFRKEMAKDVVVTQEERTDEPGKRFAFIAETWRGGSRFLDISGNRVARRVVVCSEIGEEVASIPVSTTYHRDFDFSLSPDGHRLAVLDEGVLSILEIP